jgi:hypothetical protein
MEHNPTEKETDVYTPNEDGGLAMQVIHEDPREIGLIFFLIAFFKVTYTFTRN